MRLSIFSRVAQRLSAWLLSAFVVLLALPSYAQTEVPSNWPLKPAGLGAGDEFRLLWMARNAMETTSTDIADYDAFVQEVIARIGHAHIREYSSNFKVLGSTATIDGRDHTGTTGGDGVSFRVGFRMPLGSRVKPPRWEGLGVAAGGSAPDASELWRPVEGDGRIRTVARDTVSGPVAGAEVRFLQDSVESGDSILLEVVLSSPAPEDIAVEVRLVPGAGGNPAVPGRDFVDEPVRLTIPAGASTGRVSVQLLWNNGVGENRSLSATVSLVS